MKENLCKCGCNKKVKDGNRYVHGHNRKGRISHTSKGQWSIKYEYCVECGTTKVKHRRDGYCINCVRKLIRSGELEVKRDLKLGRRSKKHKCCVVCGTITKPHHAKGLCGKMLAEEEERI